MKLKYGFVLREMAGEYLAVPFDERYKDVGGLVSLNESGAFLWKKLSEEISEEELVSAVVAEYEVSEDEAKEAVSLFIGSLRGADLLEKN